MLGVGVKQHGRESNPTPRVSPCRAMGRVRAVHPLAPVHLPSRDPRQTDASGHQQALSARRMGDETTAHAPGQRHGIARVQRNLRLHDSTLVGVVASHVQWWF